MSPADRRVLLRVDRGPYHSLTRAKLSSADRATADDLVERRLLRVARRTSRFPKRYVVTNGGLHELGSFDFAAFDFDREVREVRREICREAIRREYFRRDVRRAASRLFDGGAS